MKTTIKILVVTLLALITQLNQNSFASAITEEEKQGIQLMREEEKLAHDVYQFLYDKWNLPIFNNISNSEIRHFNAIAYLLEFFEIEDIASSEFGKFHNNEIANLYDSLTQKGSESLIEALKVGAFIEEFDIADLQRLLATNTDTTIAGVYQNLLRGSENHLRAFTGQIQSRNGNYSPVILNQTVFNEIINAPHQRGFANKNCVLQQNNCPNQQNFQGRNRNKGRNGMRRQNRWNN